MPSLNFKARFAPLIESCAVLRPIRAWRKDKRDPKKGDPLYLYTGLRTKSAKPIAINDSVDVERRYPRTKKSVSYTCKRVRHINVFEDAIRFVIHRGEHTIFDDVLNLDKFAQLDGFANWHEMRDWFSKTHGLPFNGVMIEW